MRILVVENDAGFRDAWVSLLRDFGHMVLVLTGLEGQSAVDIHAQGFDLALIDRRVRDDQDHSDTTGQDFALELCKLGTPAILVTAFIPTSIFDLLWTGTCAWKSSR
jgi:CheY-like chemotaxis protein